MPINATSKSQTPRELIPAGNYVARCYKMIEIGTIPTEFQGVQKMTPTVRFGWELPLELKIFKEENGEQPCVIEKEYTLSLADKANLRRDLKSWRGKDFTTIEAENFDVTKLLGVPCMLNIIHIPSKKDPTKFYENISSISPLPKGFNCPDQINPTFVFSFDDYDQAKFNTLPDFIKEKIATSNEYKALQGKEIIDPLPSAVDEYQKYSEEDHEDLPF
jgi:hypothetical protein